MKRLSKETIEKLGSALGYATRYDSEHYKQHSSLPAKIKAALADGEPDRRMRGQDERHRPQV